MGFRDRAASDAARILGNDQEFGERVLYNGVSVPALFSEGDSRFARGTPSGTLNMSADGIASRLTILCVPGSVEVRNGDLVERGGRKWRVARLVSDCIGMKRVELTAEESPWPSAAR